MKLSKGVALAVYNILVKEWERIANEDMNKALAILEDIWNLGSMKSTDNRFENALDDIVQHYFNNSDWDTNFLFKERLDIFSASADVEKFATAMLSPQYYSFSEHLANISTLVDYELKKDKLRLVIKDYNDFGFPLQEIRTDEEAGGFPRGLKENTIPFYVDEMPSMGEEVAEFFYLAPNKGWNDYSVVSIFTLNYKARNNNLIKIGRVKIIHKEEPITWEHLPERFLQLSEEFCSLGMEPDFYNTLQEKFNFRLTISILFALQDAAYFPDIQDRFEKTYGFIKSILRSDESERLLREVRPKLNGANMDNFYAFSYAFKPAFSKEPIEISFSFNNTLPLPDRIFAIIGRNGTGKTQLLNSLPQSLARREPSEFFGSIPSFSKVIAVSYSVFDNFRPPEKNINLNYVYCGLKDDDGDLRSSKGLSISFHYNWKKIEELERMLKWRDILGNFIDWEIINSFIVENSDIIANGRLTVSIDAFNAIKRKLSSGQSILLYIITEVVANIRYDSLILYDEPETHLHPNAVVELMNTIYKLVHEFQSFCIIATHSPIVIRELFSKNVYVVKRQDDVPSIQRIGRESFGENLGVLSDEVFADNNTPKQYKKIIRQLAKSGMTFDQIVNILQFDDVPLSLNARIYIKNYLEANEER